MSDTAARWAAPWWRFARWLTSPRKVRNRPAHWTTWVPITDVQGVITFKGSPSPAELESLRTAWLEHPLR